MVNQEIFRSPTVLTFPTEKTDQRLAVADTPLTIPSLRLRGWATPNDQPVTYNLGLPSHHTQEVVKSASEIETMYDRPLIITLVKQDMNVLLGGTTNQI